MVEKLTIETEQTWENTWIELRKLEVAKVLEEEKWSKENVILAES